MSTRGVRRWAVLGLGIVAMVLALWIATAEEAGRDAAAPSRVGDAALLDSAALAEELPIDDAHASVEPPLPLPTGDAVPQPAALVAAPSQSEVIRIVVTDARSQAPLDPSAIYLSTETGGGAARSYSHTRIFPEVVDGVFELDHTGFDASAAVWVAVARSGYANHPRLRLKQAGRDAELRTYFVPLTPE